jgi:hypothetical protein
MSCQPEKRARAEAILGELAELGLMVARDLAVRARESEDAADAVALVGAFQKASRAVRLTLALDAKLEREAARDAAAEAQAAREAEADAETQALREAERRRAEAARAAKAAQPADPIEARKDRVRGLMNRLLWNESEGDTEEYEVLVEDLNARLDEAARSSGFEALPIETLARRVIADMGLSAHPFALSLGEARAPDRKAPQRSLEPADSG